MNKLFAALMTAMILGTVAVVFVLGVMSLGGLPENTTPEAEQVTLDGALTYGTDFTDWQYLNSARQTRWRYEKADDGRQSVRQGASCRNPCRSMPSIKTRGLWCASTSARGANGVRQRWHRLLKTERQ